MNGMEVIELSYTLTYASLIGNDKNAVKPFCKHLYSLCCTFIELKFIPCMYIILVLFIIDNTIPIQKQRPCLINFVQWNVSFQNLTFRIYGNADRRSLFAFSKSS